MCQLQASRNRTRPQQDRREEKTYRVFDGVKSPQFATWRNQAVAMQPHREVLFCGSSKSMMRGTNEENGS